MRRFRQSIQELRDSNSGAAAIETAIVAPFLAVVMMGTVDIAQYGAAKLEVQQAINRGLEMAMMGGPDTSTTAIQSDVATEAGVATANVNVTQTQTCNGASATWGSSCSSGQELRKFITITVTQNFRPSFVMGVLADRVDGSNRINISATGVIRVQ